MVVASDLLEEGRIGNLHLGLRRSWDDPSEFLGATLVVNQQDERFLPLAVDHNGSLAGLLEVLPRIVLRGHESPVRQRGQVEQPDE
jgi:hypothetical protein